MGLLCLLSGASGRSCFITRRILNVVQLRTLRTTAKNHMQKERPQWVFNSSIYTPQSQPSRQTYLRCLMGRWITFRSMCQLNECKLWTRSRKQHGQWIDTVSKDSRTGLSTFSTNTAVAKDIILFEHDRTRFFRFLAFFCGGQFLFWTYLAHFAFTALRDTRGGANEAKKVRTELGGWFSFDMNLGSNAWRFGFTVACLAIGGGIIGLGILFSRRSVSRVILHKGGGMVTVSTQSPLGMSNARSMTMPLSQVACHAHRHESPSFIPLKVKGQKFYFLLDKEGKINNVKLFDITVGAYRPF
ncbi:transmembrane protein 223 [Alosa sapidissima]|uniref:transmembrane protein 223 n=1 Tax=Alosa sapidissima TaxID=34773 RepID=UPI001C09BF4D|nr:transmembrane protein 223 [Alosa sapidissima]